MPIELVRTKNKASSKASVTPHFERLDRVQLSPKSKRVELTDKTGDSHPRSLVLQKHYG